MLGRLQSPWVDDRIDEVALDTHRLLPSRVISASLVAVLTAQALGLAEATIWLAALLAAEGVARLFTRRFTPGTPGSSKMRAAFVLAGLPINLIWAALAAQFWLWPHADLKLAAVAIWVGQVIYTQNFRHQSWPLVAVGAAAPLASLIVFPTFFFAQHGVGPETARWGLMLLAANTINTMVSNRAAARRMNDLTRRLREERERALEAARAKSTFIAVASHELRTPMNGLLGMAHALSGTDLNETQRKQIGLMVKSGDNLMQLLNDVLDLSRIEAGKVELSPAPLDLRAAVETVVDTWRDAAIVKNIALTTHWDPDAPTHILADPLRIRQILTNLISNAVKFTPSGKVSISVKALGEAIEDQQALQLSVSDTGPGIPPDARARVFESFTQADSAISRQHGGAGLGLTISRALAQQMGGDLALEPSPRGACFAFSLTAPLVLAPAAPDVQEAAETWNFNALRILMAEDNAINQIVVQAMLEATGASLTLVENGQIALEAMRHSRFDCVLMDINMPVMDGVSALKAIRSGSAGDPDTPVIALTASALNGDRERFLQMGFDDHLGKPVKPAALIGAIACAVSPRALEAPTTASDALHDAA